MAGVVAPEASFSPTAVISLSAPSSLMGGAERPGWRSADHLSFEVESASVAGAEDISLLLPPVNEAAQVGADGRE